MDWKTLLTAFGLIFVAELGDKTQLAVLTMSAESGKPWMVFIGAALALTVISLIAALVGGLLAQYVPQNIIRYVSGGLFILFGILIIFNKL